ncbi:SpaA isopeptide-forming pilin-related protein [Robinsoniella peoriensis]|uniref:SpaA isopeptide-forming pilin-related protein n=1 Tax=Robinsoniella peoriensis TaxID=180332 RepID=UPI00085C7460|nr:SpaA isopeptide-forming pilin-related protein [Robinsoniella peoriensis]
MKLKKSITRIVAFVLCVVVCMTASPIWLQQSEAASLVEGISEQSEVSKLPETELKETHKKETEQVSESQNQTDTEEKQSDTKPETEKQSDTEKHSETGKKEESEKQTNTQKTESEKGKEDEEKGSEKNSEKENSEKASESLNNNKVMPKLGASEFTVDAIVAAGIEDRNFAQAIYDAIVADPTKFLDGNTLTVNNFGNVKELLGAFTGNVDGDGTGKDEAGKIKSIVGVSLLHSIVGLNLKNNLIANLNPLSITDATALGGVTPEEQKYYGLKGVNLQIDIIGNPIRRFPEIIGGRINFYDSEVPSLSGYEIPLTKLELVYFSNGEKDFKGSYVVPLDIYANDERVFFQENYTSIVEPSIDFPDIEGSGAVIPANAPKGGQISELPIENIVKSGSFDILLGVEEGMFWYFVTSRDGATPSSVTPKFYIPIQTKIYTKTEPAQLTTAHSVSLKKLGADDNKGKAGAVYNLYKKNSTGTDELVMENLTTDANGLLQVTQGLTAAEYYFQEIKAPEGYEINAAKVPFVVEDGKIIIKGGSGNQLETADGKKETVEDGVFMLSGDTNDPVKLEVHAPANGTLASITIEWTEGKGTAGKQTFTVTDTENADAIVAKAESKINDARQLYQNVKVSASFTQSLSVQQLDTLTPVNVNLKADKKLVTPNGSDAVVPEGKFKFHLVNDKTSAATPVVDEVKTNDLNGTAEFTAISIGAEGTYHFIITEIDEKDPDYVYDTNEYKAEVVISKVPGSDKLEVKSITYISKDGDKNTEAAKFTNTLLTVPFQFQKVDGDDHTKPLKDVKFSLYTCSKNHTDDSQHDVLVTNDSENCWKERETVTSDENGLVSFKDLPSGDYQLVEIQTNPDYELPLGQWRIHVDITNVQEPIQINAVGDPQPPAFIKKDAEGEVSYVLPNFKKTDLPLTGGIGTILFTLTGIILIGGAIILFIIVNRKQKRKGE